MAVLSKPVLRFDEFCVDPQRHLLTCKGQDVDLSPHLVDILEYLAARSGEIVTKDVLLDLFWPDVHVTENALTRAIADIRRALGDEAANPRYIQTAARRGYRFVATAISDNGGVKGRGMLNVQHEDDEPFREFVRGRAALETLNADRLDEAVSAFEQAVAALPEYAPAQTGLASARFLQYEGTRAWNTPRREWLLQAVFHAQRACELDPMLGEAWGTRGFALTAAGRVDEARAATRRATALEPNSWRHQFRLSVATWGEERLRACDRTLGLRPDFAPTHFAGAMVFVARQAFAPALMEAETGAAAQSRQIAHNVALFPAIGLHWLRGLLLLRDGQLQAAIESFAREVDELRQDQIYAFEFRVNAEVSTGFAHAIAGDDAASVIAFRRALQIQPGNGRALIGLCGALRRQKLAAEAESISARIHSALEELTAGQRLGEAALIKAAAEAALGDRDVACATLGALLDQAPPGHTGWLIPIDPAFAALRTHRRYPELMMLLAARAS